MFDKRFFSHEERVYVTVLLFILFLIRVHVESPKYKIVCLKLPKSSEFAIFLTNRGQTMSPQWDSKPQPLEFEAKEHLHNRMRKENCRKRIESKVVVSFVATFKSLKLDLKIRITTF